MIILTSVQFTEESKRACALRVFWSSNELLFCMCAFIQKYFMNTLACVMFLHKTWVQVDNWTLVFEHFWLSLSTSLRYMIYCFHTISVYLIKHSSMRFSFLVGTKEQIFQYCMLRHHQIAWNMPRFQVPKKQYKYTPHLITFNLLVT